MRRAASEPLRTRPTVWATAVALAAAWQLLGCGDDDTTPQDAGPIDPDAPMPMDAPEDVDAAEPTEDTGAPPSDASALEDGGPTTCPLPTLALDSEPIVAGATFERPLLVAQAPGSSDTLWIVEQGDGSSSRGSARIRLVRDGAILPTPFLEIEVDRSHNERGLLGLAFHPDYEANGRFFVYYAAPDVRRIVVAEYARSAGDPDVADPTEVQRLVDYTDPESAHNGGALAFGLDGFLYVGTGDGGGRCDNHGAIGNGQSLDTLMGKILRLDVDADAAGFAAAGNPFSGAAGLPQIWSYGLRNPWRISFDRDTADLWIGDVGQNEFEEIDFQPASSTGGHNYGWRFWEGAELSSTGDSACNDTGAESIEHTEPIVTTAHDSDPIFGFPCSITGGYVYRGAAIAEYDGVYLFGDYCGTRLAMVRRCGRDEVAYGAVPGWMRGGGLSSFGEDNAGELYVTYVGSGQVRRIVRP